MLEAMSLENVTSSESDRWMSLLGRLAWRISKCLCPPSAHEIKHLGERELECLTAGPQLEAMCSTCSNPIISVSRRLFVVCRAHGFTNLPQ